MPALANPRHEIFAQEIVKGRSQRDAYISAGYQCKSPPVADAGAARLVSDVKVTARIAELQERSADKAVVSRQWVLERLVENVNRAMTLVAAKGDADQDIGTFEYEGSVANRALELLGKELGMFVERRENTNTTYVVSGKPLSPDEWTAKYCLATPSGTANRPH